MTSLEKKLFCHLLSIARETRDKFDNILSILESEDCGNVSDRYFTMIVSCVSDYITNGATKEETNNLIKGTVTDYVKSNSKTDKAEVDKFIEDIIMPDIYNSRVSADDIIKNIEFFVGGELCQK